MVRNNPRRYRGDGQLCQLPEKRPIRCALGLSDTAVGKLIIGLSFPPSLNHCLCLSSRCSLFIAPVSKITLGQFERAFYTFREQKQNKSDNSFLWHLKMLNANLGNCNSLSAVIYKLWWCFPPLLILLLLLILIALPFLKKMLRLECNVSSSPKSY